MRLVVDSNILFSIVISGERSRAYRLVKEHAVELYLPEEAILEFREHKERLRERSEEFAFRSFLAFSLAHVIPREFYWSELGEAYELARAFDPKDTPFIALALKLRVPIWTEDRDLIKRGLETERYLALDTRAVEELLAGSSLADVLEGLRGRLGLRL